MKNNKVENNDSTLHIKILTDNKVISRKSKDLKSYKSLKPFEEYDSPVLQVLGVPFSGPYSGRDAVGEAFWEETNIWLNEGDSVPVTYYHGFGPDDPYEWQEEPVCIGRAVYTGKDKKGHWFDVKLDSEEPLAKRILIDPEACRASSGAVGHLVRIQDNGMIDSWAVGELALFDTNEWRLPANDYAIVENKSAAIQKIEAKTAMVKAAIGDDVPLNTETINEHKKEKEKMGNDNNGKIDDVENGLLLKSVIEDNAKMKADQAKFQEEITAQITSLGDELKKLFNEPGNPEGGLKAPALKKVSDMGFSQDATKAFCHWVITGDRKAADHAGCIRAIGIDDADVKAAMQEGTATEGGYLVPEDFYGQIISKKNEKAIARKAGALVIPTSLDVVNVPKEGTQADFAFTAEEASYNEDEPQVDSVAISVKKATLLIKISEELAADNKTNLEGWLRDMIVGRYAVHENKYTIAGSGTSVPQGVLVGGTAGLTFADTNAIAASEIPQLFYKLKDAYMDNAVWSLQSATMGYLMGLTGNQFQLFQPPAGPGNPWFLWQKPAYPSASMEAYSTTGKKSLVVGDWSRYAIAERSGMLITRNPYLYEASGQIGIFARIRWGGAVLQAEAFQIGTQA